MTHEIGNRTYIVADVDPLDVDGVRTLAVGVGLWVLAFVALLPFYGRLEDTGRVLVAVDLPGRVRPRALRPGVLPPPAQPAPRRQAGRRSRPEDRQKDSISSSSVVELRVSGTRSGIGTGCFW